MASPLLHQLRRFVLTAVAGLSALALASCDGSPVTEPANETALQAPPDAAKAPPPPVISWRLPLDTTGLAIRGDGRYPAGAYSVYTDGVCTVEATIFTNTGSGDATLRMTAPQGGKCGRTFTLAYPDGFRETLKTFNNLNNLQNNSFSIPVGATVRRRLIIAPGSLANNPSRCGRLLFGPNGIVSPGTDSVLVTRADASTWQVQSQAAPNDRALCEDTGAIYEMPVSFVIVSSAPLP